MGSCMSKTTANDGGAKRRKEGAAAELRRKYIIEPKILGAGSFGKVFLGTSTTDKNIKVAIKAIPKQKVATSI